MFAAVYQDDGPVGICAQSCSITRPWLQVHLFNSEQEARDCCAAGLPGGRKRPRWAIASLEKDDGWDQLVDHRTEEMTP